MSAAGRRLAIGATAALLVWLSFAVTVGQVVGARRPALVLSFGLGSAAAEAALAATLAQPGASPASLDQAERLGEQAVRREPVNVVGVRALGETAALRNQLSRADRLFNYSEQLSRRDLLTQLWLIEAEVRRGNVTGALAHYDRALRTTQAARGALFPVLIAASADPAIARALSPILDQRPEWALDFIEVLTEAPHASDQTLAYLAARLRLDPAQPNERTTLQKVVNRLVVDRAYQPAFRLYAQAVASASPGKIQDGGFDRPPLLAPFDWILAGEGDLSATRETYGGGTALSLRTAHGRAGELARQMLLLAPGSYRLSLTAAGASPDPITRAAATINCVDGRVLLTMPIAAKAQTRLSGTFAVPDRCAALFLIIAAPAGLGDGDPTVTIDDVAVQSTGGGSAAGPH